MKKNNIIAGALSLLILLSGTFAWQSFSQLATNEVMVKVDTPGARLHDYFDGYNKDVFVENYALGDYAPDVYARIRLSEYFEYGKDAGMGNASNLTILRGDIKNTQVPEFSDVTTWDIFDYTSGVEIGSESIRTYRNLNLGGEVFYLPTFNHNNTDLTPEVNGTLVGTDGDGRENKDSRYDDYTLYTENMSEVGNLITADDLAGVSTIHTTASTEMASIMSMDKWVEEGQPIGDIWVFDTTGWAYYASPISPGTATGLLLDGIKIEGNPTEEWYYAVDVKAQMATLGHWGETTPDGDVNTGMYEDMTAESMELLAIISAHEGGTGFEESSDQNNEESEEPEEPEEPEESGEVSISSTIVTGDGEVPFALSTVNTGDKIYYKAVTSNLASQDVRWELDGNTSNKTTLIDGVLTVGALESPGSILTIRAVSLDDSDISDEIYLTVLETEQVVTLTAITRTHNPITNSDGEEYLMVFAGDDVVFNVTTAGLPTNDVIWQMSGNNSSTTLVDGVLSLGDDEDTIKFIGIRATSQDNTAISDTIYLVVYPQSIEVTGETNEAAAGAEVAYSIETFGLPTDDITWSISGGVGSGNTSSINVDGILTIGLDEISGTMLTVEARSKDNILVYGESTLIVIDKGLVLIGANTADAGELVQFSSEVVGYTNQDVKWNVSGNTSNDTVIDGDGVLTIGGNELGENTMTITAEAVADGTLIKSINITTNEQSIVIHYVSEGTTTPGDSFKVYYEIEGFADESVYFLTNDNYDFKLEIDGDTMTVPLDVQKGSIALFGIMSKSNTAIFHSVYITVEGWYFYAGTEHEFEFDGLKWQVAGSRWEEQPTIDGDDVVLFYLANPTETMSFSNNGGMWDTSSIRTYLNDETTSGFLNDKSEILSMVEPYDTSRNGLLGSNSFAYSSQDKIFLLSTDEIQDYNIVPNGLKSSKDYMWTRDCYGMEWISSGLMPIAKVNYEENVPLATWSYDSTESAYVVPAFYVIDNWAEFEVYEVDEYGTTDYLYSIDKNITKW